MYEVWRDKLIAAARRDQETRARLAASGALFNGYNAEMEAVNIENAELLAQAYAEIGWTSREKLGDEGAVAAFFILQHAISRPDVQRRGLGLMLEAIPRNEANPLDAACLADRIAVLEGRPQAFGTQFDWDNHGLLSPAQIADPARVDERRATVGLPPINEAIAEMRARAAAEGERPPPDLAQRRLDYAAWARRVGWRA